MKGTESQYVVPQAKIAETIDHLASEDKRILIRDISRYGRKLLEMPCVTQVYKKMMSNETDLGFVALYLLKTIQPSGPYTKSLAKVASSFSRNNGVLDVAEIYDKILKNERVAGNGRKK